jgi:hypothetical protein
MAGRGRGDGRLTGPIRVWLTWAGDEAKRPRGSLAPAPVRRRVGFVVTLPERMERTGRTGDPAFRLVREAEDALRSLWAELHYRSCRINRPRASSG